MKILGIDPGLGRTGYAILEQTPKKVHLITCGCITTTSKSEESDRLAELQKDLNIILNKFKPDFVCIEKLFFAANVKTATTVGQARGVAVVTCALQKIPIIEVTPLQVKISVTGYGKADKPQVQRMIKTLLKLKKIPKPDDAADACAIAWAGLSRTKFQ